MENEDSHPIEQGMFSSWESDLSEFHSLPEPPMLSTDDLSASVLFGDRFDIDCEEEIIFMEDEPTEKDSKI